MPTFSLLSQPAGFEFEGFGSSASAFGFATTATTSASPFGFGSSTSTSTFSSSSAPSVSFPFNSASTSASPLYGTVASSSTTTSAPSSLFGTIASVPTSAPSLFGSSTSGVTTTTTATQASFSLPEVGVSSSSATTSAPASTPASSTRTHSTIAAPGFGDGGEKAKNESIAAAAASKASTEDEDNEGGLEAETSPITCLCAEVDRHVPSPHNAPTIKRILHKYGDITMGSILKSLDTKLAFLDLIADVVNRLCNHNLETLSSDELEIMEANVVDALAVGFNMKWLQQRVDEIKAAKYQACVKELDQQIEATKTSLMEMEQRREALAREVVAIKGKSEGKGSLGCDLSEGLL